MAIVTVAPGSASAAELSSQGDAACPSWEGELTSVAVAGPGVVTAQGSVRPKAAQGAGPCSTPRLLGLATMLAADGVRWTAVTADVPVAVRDAATGQFSQPVSVPVGTSMVCLAPGGGATHTCWRVRVSAGNGGAGPAVAVDGPTAPPVGRYGSQQDPDPNCGTCL